MLWLSFEADCDVMNNYLVRFVSKGNSKRYADSEILTDSLNRCEVTMPVNLEEQRVIIGLVSTRFDTLITLHQRKYDKLCTVKKSMLDKMFPKPGETEPEIRFEGFTDPWEQRKLGELYSLVSEKNDLTFGRESIISVANMYFNANVNVTDEQYLRTYNVMRLGDIAFRGAFE